MQQTFKDLMTINMSKHISKCDDKHFVVDFSTLLLSFKIKSICITFLSIVDCNVRNL